MDLRLLASAFTSLVRDGREPIEVTSDATVYFGYDPSVQSGVFNPNELHSCVFQKLQLTTAQIQGKQSKEAALAAKEERKSTCTFYVEVRTLTGRTMTFAMDPLVGCCYFLTHAHFFGKACSCIYSCAQSAWSAARYAYIHAYAACACAAVHV
jgi:hypothetical protein